MVLSAARAESIESKISDLDRELDRTATQCVHFNGGQCTASNSHACPFFGCDCSQSYAEGVREATERQFEGFDDDGK